MKRYVIITSIIMLCFDYGCLKDQDYSEIGNCLKHNFNIPVNISEEPDEGAYFYGHLNEYSISIVYDSIISKFNAGFYNGFTTSADNPSWVPGTEYTFRGLSFSLSSTKSVDDPRYFSIKLRGPRVDISTFDHKEELDRLEFMDELSFSQENGDWDKYRLSLSYSCQMSDQFDVDHSHKQPNDSHFRVARFKRTDLGLGWKYDIAFDIKMMMYYRDEDEVEEKLGSLEGVFSTVTYIWQ